MKRHHCAAFVVVMAVATASTHLARSQPPDVARRQYQEMRQNYTRALAALDRIEEHVAAKEYEPALAALEELVENKAKLDKAELPAIVKRSVSTWEPRILAFAKRIEEAGVRLPDSLAKRVRPPENPTRPLKPATGATRYEILGAKGISADGRRKLADFEIDVYGPLPFPETVAKFIDDEVSLLLELQNEDGSFRFLGGRKTEAGGTVGLVTQASLCGHSLREHVEVNPEAIEAALSKTLDYVVYMVRSGKLRTDVWDSTWRHTYALRFLVHEYPHVEDQRTKALVEDACGLLVDELRNLQQGTTAQKSQAVRWQMPSPPGMVVRDDAKTGRAVVAECPTDSPAHKAGIQEGDFLLTASGEPIDTVLGYYMNRMFWLGGDSIEIGVSRGGETKTLMMHLPHRFPGTLGFACEQDGDGGVTVAAFDPLSNPDRAPINVGDRIVKVDQTEIATLDEFTNLSFFSGQEVEVGIERDGRPQTLRLICVPQEAADFGVEIERSLDQARLDGLTIKQLQSDSCLKGAGLEPGDRLLRINDTPILNRRRFRELERTFWGGQRVNVTYRSASDQQERDVEVKTGARPHDQWLKKGYHGLSLAAARDGIGAVIASVAPESPAAGAGCRAGDVIRQINGNDIARLADAQQLLGDVFSGETCRVTALRDGQTTHIEWTAHRPTDSPWISGDVSKSGGWVYYPKVRGGTTFLSSDILRILLDARTTTPVDVPSEMIDGPFQMLSNLRLKQPNCDVESYRYDAGGSFWGVKDIRGDVGRLPAAELACLRYCDASFEHDHAVRTQEHLARALGVWLDYRGILDLVRTGDHAQFGIAHWYWPYSYWMTLQAADYLTVDDALKDRVQRTALKAYFKYTTYGHVKDLDGQGWQVGYLQNKKELLRTCLLLDGLATIKHLYRPTVTAQHPALPETMAAFNATRYGEAFVLLAEVEKNNNATDDPLATDIKRIRAAIQQRFAARLDEVKAIQTRFPHDGLRHLEVMRTHFTGYPDVAEVDALVAQARSAVPIRVACVGDSITAGGAIGNAKMRYPAQLGTMLGERWSVRNFGVSGATLLKKGDKPYFRLSACRMAHEFQPDVVVIKLGTNDSKPHNWKHKVNYVADYVDLIDSFRALESRPRVLVCYPVPAFPGRYGITDKVMKEEVIPLIDEVAEKTGAPIIDLYAALSDKKDLFPDAVHPNAAGATVLAKTIAAAICDPAAVKADHR